MKFVCNILINKPANEVSNYFEDPEALMYSQDGFIKMEHLSGDIGKSSAKSKLIYKKFDLIETIIHNNLPNEFYAKYEHEKMTNTMRSNFIAISDNETKLITTIEYNEFKGFVIKLIAKVFPSMFKKQVDKWLIKFKDYCEKQ